MALCFERAIWKPLFFFTPYHRFYRRTQLTHMVRTVLKLREIARPNLVPGLEEHPQGLQTHSFFDT